MECKPWRMPKLRPVPESPPRTQPPTEQLHEPGTPEAHSVPRAWQHQAYTYWGKGSANSQLSAFAGGKGRNRRAHTAL